MKLADALALRKELNRKVKASITAPTPVIHKANIPASEGTSQLETLARQQRKAVNLALVEHLHAYNALQVVDTVIYRANQSNHVSVPVWTTLAEMAPYNPVPARTQMTLSEGVLLRKRLEQTLKAYNALETVSTAKALPPVQRSARPGSSSDLDSVTITLAGFVEEDLPGLISLSATAFREVNSAVQERNWAVDVQVPEWVSQAAGSTLHPLNLH